MSDTQHRAGEAPTTSIPYEEWIERFQPIVDETGRPVDIAVSDAALVPKEFIWQLSQRSGGPPCIESHGSAWDKIELYMCAVPRPEGIRFREYVPQEDIDDYNANCT